MREVAWVVRDDVLERTHFDSYIIDITAQKKSRSRSPRAGNAIAR